MAGTTHDDDAIYNAINVAKRLKGLRLELGLNQTNFAKACGLRLTQLADWEAGRMRMSLEGSILIYNAYNVGPDYLFLGRKDGLPYKLGLTLE